MNLGIADRSERTKRRRRAFSLLELLLAVSLMSVIVLALYGMFHHTQRALRSSVTQVDVLEAGRATMDMLTRDLAQMSACDLAGGTNFMVRVSEVYKVIKPVVQPLPGAGPFKPNEQPFRTNLLQDVFLLSRFNKDFNGTLYRVLYADNGVGTLSRFTTNIPASYLTSNNLITNVLLQPPTNLARIADGVIHFRAAPYDADGLPMTATNRYTTNIFLFATNLAGTVLYTNIFPGTNFFLWQDKWVPKDALRWATNCAFLSNLLPAYVEIELGVLEQQTLEQFKTFAPGSAMATNFLASHVGQVHLFRQRVPIRQSPPMRAEYP
jgi:prepilin-type N-terminal cleavage/methylation domain-containing protein